MITSAASTRVATHAFKVAEMLNRKKVTAVHKANIMFVDQSFHFDFDEFSNIFLFFIRKQSDGLFLKSCQEVAARYPHIPFEIQTLDQVCLKVRIFKFLSLFYYFIN